MAVYPPWLLGFIAFFNKQRSSLFISPVAFFPYGITFLATCTVPQHPPQNLFFMYYGLLSCQICFPLLKYFYWPPPLRTVHRLRAGWPSSPPPPPTNGEVSVSSAVVCMFLFPQMTPFPLNACFFSPLLALSFCKLKWSKSVIRSKFCFWMMFFFPLPF